MKQNMNASENKTTKTKKPANRKLTRGAMSLLLTVLFIAAVVLVNIVLSVITNTHPLYIDVTENASYQLQKETKRTTVALSGGVYQNTLLLDLTKKELEHYGFHVLCHRMIPPNDGGIGLGQAYYAMHMLNRKEG